MDPQTYLKRFWDSLIALCGRLAHEKLRCQGVSTPLHGLPKPSMTHISVHAAGYEPTSMRAIRARYNPYVQARGRVDQLRRLGHSVDKVLLVDGRLQEHA